jgi:SAM-dependent methyltransferase
MEIKIVWNSDKYRHALIKYITKSLYSKKLVEEVSNIVSCAIATDSPQISDMDVLSKIKKVITAASSRKNTLVGSVNDTRIKERLRILNKFIKCPVRQYCDIGCGDGRLTADICKELGNPYTLGIDTYPVNESMPITIINGQLVGKIKGINYMQNTSLDFIDTKFNLITSFMTLHHIEPQYLLQTILFVHRTLTTNGIFLIREHDCVSNKKINEGGSRELNSFLNLIHLYNNDTSYCQFKSADEWIEFICKIGFKLVKIIFYNEPNPQRIFHASFIKSD